MAKEIAAGGLSPGLKVGGTDLSAYVRSIRVQMNTEDVDLTAMGAVSREHGPGLRDDLIEVTFFQDYQPSKVDATVSALVGVAAGATIIAYAHGVTAASTAPSYTMVGFPLNYEPINVEIGNATQTTIQFVPSAGSYITRGTS